MSRIEPVPERHAGWFVRLIYRVAKQRLGKVPGPLRVMAHHPTLLAGTGAFEMSLERSRRVEARLKNLAQIRVATLIGCLF
jgi:hypothetical protein